MLWMILLLSSKVDFKDKIAHIRYIKKGYKINYQKYIYKLVLQTSIHSIARA